jgi:hypothetical protein
MDASKGAGQGPMIEECKRHFLPHYGNKKELCARLKEHLRAFTHSTTKKAKSASISDFFATV